MTHRRRRALLAGILALCTSLTSRSALAQTMYNPRDDQFRTLGLIRAEAEYRRASATLERNRQLRARGFLSAQQLEERSEAWRPWRGYAAFLLWCGNQSNG